MISETFCVELAVGSWRRSHDSIDVACDAINDKLAKDPCGSKIIHVDAGTNRMTNHDEYSITDLYQFVNDY